MIGIGIDPALGGQRTKDGDVTGTGIVAVAFDERFQPTLLTAETFTAPKDYPTLDRFIWLCNSVRMFVLEHPPNVIAIEDPTGFKGGVRSHVGGARLGGATAAVAIGARIGIDHVRPEPWSGIHGVDVSDWIPSRVKHDVFKRVLESQFPFARGLPDDQVYAIGVLMYFVKRSPLFNVKG